MLFKIIKFRFLLIFVILALIIGACNKKDNNQNGNIPNVNVNFYLQPDGIDFIPITNWKYIDNEGYRGIIIYRIDQFTFNAYERTCPYDPQKECARVEVDKSGVLMVDSCCMSFYSILDGMPAGGPSTLPLKQYFSEFNDGILHIYYSP